jgi:hypothetical protein
MVDATELALLLAVTSALAIPGLLKLLEFWYEFFQSRKGFIKVIYNYPNRAANHFYVKPKMKEFVCENHQYAFNDHPDYIMRYGFIPTVIVDSSCHKQIKIHNTEARDAGLPTPEQLDGLGRQAYSLGFREALKKIINIDRYFLLLGLGLLINIIATLFMVSKVIGGAPA